MLFEELKSPCFIIRQNLLSEVINDFKASMSKFFPKNILAYSVKTNSLPFILNFAKKNNCYLEVVSFDEYNLAKKLGNDIKNIVYNGPMKDEETFLEAVKSGAYVNIETKRELEWLTRAEINSYANIGIRLNINLEKINNNDIDGKESRFGFSFENNEFKQALNSLRTLKTLSGGGFNLGIHVHRTSKYRSLNTYRNICRYACRIINSLNADIKYFDIGGGFYGRMPNKPSFEEYFETIYSELNKYIDTNNITFIAEPGNAIAAPCIDYLFSIIDIKNIEDKIICTSDASRIDIDPLFHKEKYLYEIHKKHLSTPLKDKQIITGCTCLEKDYITSFINDEELKAGDRILFKYQGAYTSALSPNFIRLQPNVYVEKDNNYTLVRKKFSADEWILNNYLGEER